jgi:hypothetical protein
MGLNRFQPLAGYAGLMPRFAAKALLTMLTASRSHRSTPNWDRIIIMVSTAVTIGLVALFLYGKSTARW